MILKRLFPTRWAKILAWTGASLAWGTTLIAVAANAAATDAVEQPEAPVAIDPPTTTTVATTTVPIPDMPERGLVVVRYTPVPPPPPQVVTRTVVVAGPSGGGGGGSTAPAAAAPAPAVSAPVKSSGS